MNLKQLFLTKNECYAIGRTIIPKGIMVHSTAANNSTLKRYVGPNDGLLGVNTNNNHWNQFRPDGEQKCVHAFIGKLADGTIATYQTLPWTMRSWHAGGKANDTHIGFEICEDGLADANYFNKIYREAIELCVYLCKLYNLNPLQDIICHSEGYKRSIASNHADVMHWFPKFGKNMDTFRNDVKIEMEGDLTMSQYEELKRRIEDLESQLSVKYGYIDNFMPSWAHEPIKTLMNEGILKGNESGNLQLSDLKLWVATIVGRAVEKFKAK